jgi:hypothetical protein
VWPLVFGNLGTNSRWYIAPLTADGRLWIGTMQKMDGATTYEEWLQAASALDELEGADQWKHKDESSYYDSELIRQRLQEMQRVSVLPPLETTFHAGNPPY